MDAPDRVISKPRAQNRYDFSVADLRRGLIEGCGEMSRAEFIRESGMSATSLKRIERQIPKVSGVQAWEARAREARAREAEAREAEAREAEAREAREAELLRKKQEEEELDRKWEEQRKAEVEREARWQAARETNKIKYQEYLNYIPSVLSDANVQRLRKLSTRTILDPAAAKQWDAKFRAMQRKFDLSDRLIKFGRCFHTFLLPKNSPYVRQWEDEVKQRILEKYERSLGYATAKFGPNWRTHPEVLAEIKREQQGKIERLSNCRLCAKRLTLRNANKWNHMSDHSSEDNLDWIIKYCTDAHDVDDSSDDEPIPEETATFPSPATQCYVRTERALETQIALYTFLYREPDVLSPCEFGRLMSAVDIQQEYDEILAARSRHGAGHKSPRPYLSPELRAKLKIS